MAIQLQHHYRLLAVARKHFSLRSAHLVMWSSPLLLLVLLFTLTATSKTPTRLVIVHEPSTVSSTSPTTTTVVSSTTTSSAPMAVTTTTMADRSTTTTMSNETHFAVATSSTVRSPAPAPSVSVSSGVVTGALSRAFAVAVVPLRGPGTWTLSSSAPITAQLLCPNVSGPVNTLIVVNGTQSCQLQLTSANAEVSPTWQLTPLR
jgi:hypothetical protein